MTEPITGQPERESENKPRDLSQADVSEAEKILAEPAPTDIRELDQEREPEVAPDEISRFLQWQDRQKEKYGLGKVKMEEFFDAGAIADQFLLWGHSSQEAEEKVRKWAKEKSGEKNFKERLRAGLERIFSPAKGVSFPWQTAMSRLLDERVNELQNVEYDSSIRDRFLNRAFKNKDEFTAQVIMLSLAMTSDFRQEILDEYYEIFGEESEMEDPNHPGETIKVFMPDTKQLWFENKLRRTANRSKTFGVWKGSRFRQDWDEQGNVTVRLASREEIARGGDVDAALIGGRRGDLASENFGYNTINDQQEANATNQFLKIRLGKIPGQIAECERKIVLLSRYKDAVWDEQQQHKTKALIELYGKRKGEFEQQIDIIEAILAAGGYQSGDLKSMLLDPLSSEKTEIDGKIFKEKEIAADLGFTKYMVSKLATDTNITLNGEHAAPADIKAFMHLMSLRRRLEYAWIASHSLYGVRNPTTLEYDEPRNAYLNMASALAKGDERQWGFALGSQGFYIGKHKEQGEEKNYIIAPTPDKRRMVRVVEFTNTIEVNLRERGYLDGQVALKDRQADFNRLVQDAISAGRFVDKEPPAEQRILGDMGNIIFQNVELKPDEEYDQERILTNTVNKILKSKKELKEKLDLTELLKARETGQNDIPSIVHNMGPFISSLGKEAESYGVINSHIQDGLSRQFQKKFTEFKNQGGLEKAIVSLEKGEKPDWPELSYQDLVQDETLARFKKNLEEERTQVEEALNKLNPRLQQACSALVLQRQVQKQFINHLDWVAEVKDMKKIDFSHLSLEAKQALLNRFNERVKKSQQFRQEIAKKIENGRSLQKRLTDKEVVLAKAVFSGKAEMIKEDETVIADVLGPIKYLELIYDALSQKLKKEGAEELSSAKKEEQEVAKAA